MRDKDYESGWMVGFFMGVFATLVIMALAAIAHGQTPQAEVIAAYQDCSKLDQATARQTRYLTMYNWALKERTAFLKLMSMQANNLSREGEIVIPRQVSPTLLALCCDDYGWPLTTYGGLHETEPYFHVKLRIGKEETTAHAPWLPTKEIAELAKMTGSIVPILRADWWIHATSQPKTYYSFLGIEKLSDLEKSVGLDRKLIESKRKDLAAVVDKSSVTINARAIFRLQGSMGAWYESRDNRDPKGNGNPLRHLDKDYTFAAREIYARLPNGLWAKALATDKDDLIGEAPPDVASDSTSRTSDHRVVCPRCDICHGGQLRIPNDYFRANLGGGFGIVLGVPVDREKAKRLRSLYFGPIYEEIAADNLATAAVMKRLDTTPVEYSKAYADAFYGYEDLVSADTAAREFGVTKEAMIAALKEYAERVGVSDLGLTPYLAGKPIVRSHHEEMYAVVAGVLYTRPKGAKP